MTSISICFGPNWASYVPTQVHSILNRNPKVLLNLVSNSFTPDFEKKIQFLRDFHDSPINLIDAQIAYNRNLLKNKNVSPRFSRFTLYRLLLPIILPDPRTLYLDADTLVLSDIRDFMEADLGGAFIGGCVDTGIQKKHLSGIGFQEGKKYFNAGVLLMDLEQIRGKKIHTKWIDLVNRRRFGAHDQDVINLSCQGSFFEFGPEYNCSLSTSLDLPDESIKIMHYAGVKDENWVKKLPKSHFWDQEDQRLANDYEAHWRKYLPPAKINKIIAYGWFGKGEKPEKIKNCIESWKKFCPDYEIIEMNETNCNVNEVPYVKRAYETKKWAFVADYFRMKFMYDLGCVTLDADVELLKPLDEFLHHGFFSGQEVPDKIPITATMGAEKGSPIVGMILEYYKLAEFDPDNPIPNTQFISRIFQPLIVGRDNGTIRLAGDGHIYPKHYFCNYDHRTFQVIPDKNSYAIHHFQGSWKDAKPAVRRTR